jgi:exosortase/archaeosortase family protein
MIKFIDKSIQKLSLPGFRNFLISLIAAVAVLYAEKRFYPVSKELVKLNMFGRTSVIIVFLIIVIFFAFEKKNILNLKNFKFGWRSFFLFFPLHIISFLSFWFFKKILIENPHLLQEYFAEAVFVRYLLPTLIILFLALAIFDFSFMKKFYRSLFLSFFLAFAFFQVSLFFKQYWKFFSKITTKLVAFLLNFSFSDVSVDYGVSGPSLGAGGFRALIHSPCSGIEGLSLFLFLFILIMVLDRKEIDWFRASLAGVVGLGGMFLVNVIRIYLLYLVGIYVNPRVAVSYFHTNVGWLLFIIYFVLYWFLVYFFIRKNKRRAGG